MNQDPEQVSKIAGKASGLFVLMIVLGCALPLIVICVGAMFTK